jgi:hypothetical protein
MTKLSDSNLPSFLCIGAQKAATSWLWIMLRQHPQIWMPPIKEIHFFDHLHIPEFRTWTHYHIKKGVSDALKWHVQNEEINLGYFKYLVDVALVSPFTEDWYRFCFDRPPACGKVTGDITPEYCTLPQEGVQHVKNLLGENVKLIYLIRDPVERALSQLKMNLTRLDLQNEDENFWLAEAKKPVIFQRGDYKTYIPRWEAAFPRANILYLPYQKVGEDPADLLSSIEDHIGVNHYSDYSNITKRIHKTKETQVPKNVIAYLHEALAPQVSFLQGHFDTDFCRQI